MPRYEDDHVHRPSRNLYGSADQYGENIGQEPNRGQHFGKGPKGWKRSDEIMREDVCEALYRDPYIDASDIEVSVKDSCVHLRGTVDSRDVKRAAEDCAERLLGVEDVRNELSVKRANDNRETSKAGLS